MVLDNAPALIGYVDGGLRYIFCNHTYLEWYGREPANCTRGQTPLTPSESQGV